VRTRGANDEKVRFDILQRADPEFRLGMCPASRKYLMSLQPSGKRMSRSNGFANSVPSGFMLRRFTSDALEGKRQSAESLPATWISRGIWQKVTVE